MPIKMTNRTYGNRMEQNRTWPRISMYLSMGVFSFFILAFFASISNAALQPVGPIGFGKGLNLKANVTAIDDQQTPDSCNCISNQDGSLSKRFGSQRYIQSTRSTGPVSGLYRAYASTGTTQKKILMAIIGTDLVYSTDDANPQWILLSSGMAPNQNWSFVTMNNDVYLTGDRLLNPVMKFNVLTSSFFPNIFGADGSSESVILRAKYLLQKSNYLMFVNVMDLTNGTTYYPDRVYYSPLNTPSSATYSRFLGMPGEELTGAITTFDNVNFLKPSSIIELSFTDLNLPSKGGNQVLTEIVNGFGLKAPQVLASIGGSYVIGASDGIRLYDGGRRNRLNVSDESRKISDNIQPIIDKLIKGKTYERMTCKYYKKREWLIFSYEDPDKFPHGRNNSILVCDLRNGEWYPVCGWLAQTFETRDSFGDDGSLLYGDSADGFVYLADIEKAVDDANKQTSIDTMDTNTGWVGSNFSRNTSNIAEGTASLRMWVNASVTVASMTKMAVFNMGEFYDKSKVSKSTGPGFSGDSIQFKLHCTSIGNITSLRVDLEINDVESQFDATFTSVTLSSAAILSFSSMTVSGDTWAIVEVPLSSFHILSEWTHLDSELQPFAETQFYYGLRLAITGINISTVSIDDVRLVQERNPVNFYRFTKLYDFGTSALKTIGQVLVTMDKQRDSSLTMDVYNDFGKQVNTISFDVEMPRELLVFGITSTASIAVMDDLNFAVKQSTDLDISQYYPLNGVSDKNYIFYSDRMNNRMVKARRSDFVSVSTFGSLGDGTTNQNIMHQIDIDENNRIFGVDLGNNRIKSVSQSNLAFIAKNGGLGREATSYHTPTGITVNETDILVADEGNLRWKKVSVSSFGYILSVGIDYNAIGETSIEQDSEFYYGAYNKIAESDLDLQDIVVEKRGKGDLSLVQRFKVFKDDVVSQSTNSLMGDIAIRGRYLFIPFTDGRDYFIQKRLKSNGELVRQYRASRAIASVLGDPFAHKPSLRMEKKDLTTSGRYVQIKYYDSGPDNDVKLVNQTFVVDVQPITY